jgi:hypothetical protein
VDRLPTQFGVRIPNAAVERACFESLRRYAKKSEDGSRDSLIRGATYQALRDEVSLEVRNAITIRYAFKSMNIQMKSMKVDRT